MAKGEPAVLISGNRSIEPIKLATRGAAEMAYWVKRSLPKSEDLSSDPWSLQKSDLMQNASRIPALLGRGGRERQETPPPLAGQPDWLT